MLELGVLLAFVVGACWLFGALVVGVFKLTFGLLGAIFGGLFGVFALAIVALVALPLMLLVLLPLVLPVLGIALLVWIVVHASRAHPQPPRPVQG